MTTPLRSLTPLILISPLSLFIPPDLFLLLHLSLIRHGRDNSLKLWSICHTNSMKLTSKPQLTATLVISIPVNTLNFCKFAHSQISGECSSVVGND